jgi:hypothetical protein
MSEGWIRLGRVLEASGGPLTRTHVMLPTPLVLADRVRIYFTSCDDSLRGRVFDAEFAPEPPFPLIRVGREPVMDLGAPGQFDCDGVNPSQVLRIEGQLCLLYIGWRRGPPDEPYTLFAGWAASTDEGRSFQSRGRLLEAVPGERLFRTAPHLVREDQGWRLLYIGGDRFVSDVSGKRLPVYSLMQMRSADPLGWIGQGQEVIAPDIEAGDIVIGRPERDDGRLIVSVRTAQGYELMEGDDPERAAGHPALTPVFEPPFERWETQMRCFGAPCRVGDHELLFHNGDGFGSTGMGLAYRPISSR